MQQEGVVIVGAGQAGAQVAALLRHEGYKDSITLVGDECEFPYERPPLSKDYLAGNKQFDQLLLRSPEFWSQHDIDLRLGQRVVSVDVAGRSVRTESGEEIGYESLVWATGGSPRRLDCAGEDLSGVHAVRSRADIDRIMAELSEVHHVVVVGGGYIGLEAASVLTKLGKSVTVLETLNRVLARVAGETLSRFYEAEHRSHGVDVRLGVTVKGFEGQNGRVTGVTLGDGAAISADLVIVGIGIIPSVGPLVDAGLKNGNGVVVDEYCRTHLPGIFAVGDCAAHINRYSNICTPIRLESVQNANDQAKVVAKFITGQQDAYDALPWFWSDQYDLKLQTAGLSIGHDAVVVRGDVAARTFSIIYLRQGRVIALDCVNAVRDFAQGKALVKRRLSIDPESLADVAKPLKSLAEGGETDRMAP